MDEEFELRVRERAYQLWHRAGSPEGGEEDFWYQAEQEIYTEIAIETARHRSDDDGRDPS